MLDLEQIKNYISGNLCRSAVVIGGGYLALKAVESLYNFGLPISLIHNQEHVFEDFDTDIANLVQSELLKQGVHLYLNASVRKIAPGIVEDSCFVTCTNDLNIAADLVVVAIGLTPRTEIAKDSGIECRDGVVVNAFMQTSHPDVYAVGDISETQHLRFPTPNRLPLGGPASQQGRIAADHIMKRAISYRGCVGTYNCKVFNVTAAITGPSVKRLRELGYYPLFVTVHVPEHTGYYPASHQMTLRLAFQSGSGRVLSAQIVGRSGVERRIDVLSTALQAGMTVFDLETLELSYAPQYGSAKDPVNTIGMVACNLVRGDVHLVTARELDGHLGDWQIIDVRSREDFAKEHVKSALNFPIDTLRDNLAHVDKQREVVVYSRVGYHGYLAYRTLVQLGYHVSNLDGGLRLLIEGGSEPALLSTG
jgi:rhodanese-related sulfurtransferase